MQKELQKIVKKELDDSSQHFFSSYKTTDRIEEGKQIVKEQQGSNDFNRADSF